MEEARTLAISPSAKRQPKRPQLFCLRRAGQHPIILNQRFRLLELIAVGGTSYVHRARDLAIDVLQPGNGELAIKVPRCIPQLRQLGQNFRAQTVIHEALLSRTLAHRNILRVFDFHREGNIHFLTMEHIRGEPLTAFLLRAPQRRLGSQTAAAIVRCIAAALLSAHRHGVVHSDVKPGNILIGHRGELKLIDFANARRLQGSVSFKPPYKPPAHFGFSSAYSSFETMEDLPPTTSDDLFSLGCITYEMLTGRHPYNRCSPIEALTQDLTPQRPAATSYRQWTILRKALQLRAAERLHDAADFLRVF
jgi:serine/threonine protein kinase